MKATQLEYGKLQSSLFKLFQKLGEAGGEVISRLDEDAEYADRVARFMLRGGAVVSEVHCSIARAIMGTCMLGVEEVQHSYGVTLAPEELMRAKKIPYSEEKLSACRNTHLLVFGYPIGMVSVANASRFEILYSSQEYPEGEPAFLTDSVPFGWYLISRSIVTSGGSFEPGAGNRLPTRAEAVYAYVLRNLVSPKSYPLRNTLGLCAEAAAGGEVYLSGACGGLITRKTKPEFKPRGSWDRPLPEGALAVVLPDS